MSAAWWIVFAAYLAAATLVPFLWLRYAARRNRPPLPQRTPANVAEHRARRIAETNARLQGIPAAPDNTEGMRLDWHDQCELLWSAPFDPQIEPRKEGA